MVSTDAARGVIFHIAFERDWQQALERGSYEISTRGRTLVEDVEGAGDVFPHISGPLNPSAVVAVHPASVTDGSFAFGDGTS